MSDRSVTLFEYHSHGTGPQFFPNAFAGEETEPEPEPEPEPDEDGGGGLALVAFLLVLLGVAIAIRYLRDGEGVPSLESEQVAVTEFED